MTSTQKVMLLVAVCVAILPYLFRRRAPPGDLDRTAFHLGVQRIPFTFRDLHQNLFVCGSVGAGKTTCLFRPMVEAFKNGAGALVLIAKNGDVPKWVKLAKAAGKEAVLLGIGHKYHLNILGEVYKATLSVESVVAATGVLHDAFSRKGDKGQGHPFYDKATDQLVRHAATLVILASGSCSFSWLSSVIRDMPKHGWYLAPPDKMTTLTKEQRQEAEAWREASDWRKVADAICRKWAGLTEEERLDFKAAYDYFVIQLPGLDPETKSNICAGWHAMASAFSVSPLRELIASTESNIDLTRTFRGQVFVLDAATHVHGVTGLMFQVAVKYTWMCLAQKRDGSGATAILHVDEYPEFHSRLVDVMFAGILREYRIGLWFMCQNIATLYAINPNHDEVNSLVSNLRNQVAFSVTEEKTCRWLSELAGKTVHFDPAPCHGESHWFMGQTAGFHSTRDYAIPTHRWGQLVKAEGHAGEAVLFKSGQRLPNGKFYMKLTLEPLYL